MTGIFKINNNEVFGSDGTFSGTIGSSATFPNGLIEEQNVIKYAFANNGSYTNEGASEKVSTRKNGDDTAVESVSVIGGYTYIYTYNYFV